MLLLAQGQSFPVYILPASFVPELTCRPLALDKGVAFFLHFSLYEKSFTPMEDLFLSQTC